MRCRRDPRSSGAKTRTSLWSSFLVVEGAGGSEVCGRGDLFRRGALHKHWTIRICCSMQGSWPPGFEEVIPHSSSCKHRTRSFPSPGISLPQFIRRNTASYSLAPSYPEPHPAPVLASGNIPPWPHGRQHRRMQGGVQGAAEIRGWPETSRLAEKGGAHGVGTSGVETFHERVESFWKVPQFRGVSCSVRGFGQASSVDVS